jgi:iron complex outermembrane receptor protein
VNVSNAFQSGYDPSQYDPRGRFVYLTGTFKF